MSMKDDKEYANKFSCLYSDLIDGVPPKRMIIDGVEQKIFDGAICTVFSGNSKTGSTYDEYYMRDGEWQWIEDNRAFDHNRLMLGLGLSYKTGHKNAVTTGNNAVYRFKPGGSFHHAEMRIIKLRGGDMRFQIFALHDIADLPAKVLELRKHNQKGLMPVDENSQLIYDYHGIVTDAELAVIIGSGIEVDTDYFYSEPNLGSKPGNSNSSALPSGRHYSVDTEYLITMSPANGDDIDYFYTYFWHED